MTQQHNALIEDYLSRVSRATAGLPGERREELLHDLREHINTARAGLTDETESEIHEILDRLGDPITIAGAAAAETTGPLRPLRSTAEPRRRTGWIIAAIAAAVTVLVLCAGFLTLFSARSSQPVPATPVSATP